MNTKQFCIIAVYCCMASSNAYAEWTISFEDLIANIDATVAVCADLDPEGVKKGLATLDAKLSEQEKARLPVVRATKEYFEAYNAEKKRLENMPVDKQTNVCRKSW